MNIHYSLNSFLGFVNILYFCLFYLFLFYISFLNPFKILIICKIYYDIISLIADTINESIFR